MSVCLKGGIPVGKTGNTQLNRPMLSEDLGGGARENRDSGGKGQGPLCSGKARNTVWFGPDEGGEDDKGEGVRGLGRARITWAVVRSLAFI